ncbi:MAG: peptidoglycan-associated lipoprotein Pal [Succinivibrio sp.]|jgi:peptidoglycan-associated lipoprotein|nr:peptidoglycan-associated lipoprotein Pal [Succinivibrio sp.]
MLKNFLFAFVCGAALIALPGCSSDSDNSGLVSDDGTDIQEGLDSDGAVTVGNPGASDGWHGPAELQDQHTVYFNYDSDTIQDQYVGVLQANAKYLRSNPDARVVVEGHTDERGTPEYNIALGERRARSVARYLQNLGVDLNQISVVSYGEEKPVNPGHDESAWSQNRRAVLNY